MPFAKDFPSQAIHALADIQNTDQAHIALAAYEVLGYGLHLYYGDVAWLAGLDFASLSAFAEGADLATKIRSRALELKAGGAGTFLIILKLLAEFGPVIVKLADAIRSLLNKPQV